MRAINGYSVDQIIDETGAINTYRAHDNKNQRAVIIRQFLRDKLSPQQYQNIPKEYTNVIDLLSSSIEKILDVEIGEEVTSVISEDSGLLPLNTITHNRSLSILEILQISIGVVDALDKMHQSGFIHKNINANTILVDEKTLKIKLSGLGFSSNVPKVQLDIYSPNQIEGDIQYISPEQTGRMNRSVDYRSDYYSLGTVLYELIAGVLPCQSVHVQEVIYCHIAKTPEKLEVLNPVIPTVLASIINKLMAKTGNQRYQSAVGIISDLKNCVDQIKLNGFIESFELAGNDHTQNLLISEKLYGRENQIDLLKLKFNEASNGGHVSAYIAGRSGTGKSTITREFRRYIGVQNSLFLQGKFDQTQRNAPYSVFIEVINQFSDFLLTLNKNKLRNWKQIIKDAIGENLRILTELSPNMATIFVDTIPLSTTGEAESKNRFNTTLVNFFSIIASKEYPLVICIDDLQWGDAPSIELFYRLITADSISYALFLGLYRDNEVEANVALVELLTADYLDCEKPATISVGNLNSDDVVHMLEDVLQQKSEKLESLALQLYSFSNGNPYYVKQLIQNLSSEGFFQFDNERRKWFWGDIENIDISNNVVDLITARLERLSPELKEILQYAAVMGNRFLLEDIALILKKNEDNLLIDISPLIDSNFIVYHSIFCRFYHDGIQQAILNKMSDVEISQIHWNVGYTLLENFPDDLVQDRIHEIVSHLNQGYEQTDLKNRDEILLRYNLKAAEKSISDIAYDVAEKYAQHAIKYLPVDSWMLDQDATFKSYFLQSKSEYLIGKTALAAKHINELLKHTHKYEEDVLSFSLLKDIYINSGQNYNLILDAAVCILEKHDIEIDLQENKLKNLIEKENNSVNLYFRENPADSILNLPRLTDSRAEFCVRFFMELWEAAYYSGRVDLMQYCVLKMLNQSFRYGNLDESCFAYVLYSSILSSQGEFKKAYEIGRLGLDLNQTFHNRVLLPKINNLFANYTSYHSKPFSENAALYQESMTIARSTGDYIFGVWATLFYIWSLLLSGVCLDEILYEIRKHFLFVKQTHDQKIIYTYQMLEKFVLYFQEKSVVNDDLSELEQYIDFWLKENFIPGAVWFAILESQKLYSEQRYDQAIKKIEKYATTLSPEIIMFPISQFYFFYGLNIIGRARQRQKQLDAEELIVVNNCLAEISFWAESSKENFSFQEYLLRATLAELANEVEAGHYFSLAIQAAELSNSNYSQALCYELRAYYYQGKGEVLEFQNNIENALDFYKRWGGMTKVNQLKVFQKPGAEEESDSFHKMEETNEGIGFDSLAIIEASQAISSEINEGKLLEKMLSIIVKNTYAQRGVVIVCEDDSYYVRVIIDSKKVVSYDNNELLLNNYLQIPCEVVHDAVKLRSDIVVGDAISDSAYSHIPYIQQAKVKSIFCTPVYYQNNLAAIVYLENNLSNHVFDKGKLQFVRYLNTQMGISLENSRLYHNLQTQMEETKIVEKALRISEDRMRRSQQYANVGTWEWDLATNALFWSATAKNLFGFNEDHDISHVDQLTQIIYPEDVQMVQDAVDACMRGGDYYVEHRIITADGKVKWVSESGDVLRDADQKPVKMFGLVQDIDARKKSEREKQQLKQQLQQSQKMEAIGQLTGGIAHDFNNMLASILGYTELALMQDAVKSSAKLENYLSEIQKAGDRAKHLVQQMMVFGRENKSDREVTEIYSATVESINMLQSVIPSSIEIGFESSIAPENISVSSVQLHQIILNLCINARDAMHGKGKILLQLQNIYDEDITCDSCHKKIADDYVCLSVSDNGDGIEYGIRNRLFEPFFTTKGVGKGTGMGLSMVHGIMHGARGHIQLESEVGKGSKFSLFFPVEKHLLSEPETAIVDEFVDDSALRGVSVLVVDDELSITLFLKELLVDKGYDVISTNDSREALKLLFEDKEEFQIIITDQTMPGCTGIDLAKKVLEERLDTSVILSTGYHETVDEEVAKLAGCKAFLRKPFEANDLLSKMHEVLKK